MADSDNENDVLKAEKEEEKDFNEEGTVESGAEKNDGDNDNEEEEEEVYKDPENTLDTTTTRLETMEIEDNNDIGDDIEDIELNDTLEEEEYDDTKQLLPIAGDGDNKTISTSRTTSTKKSYCCGKIHPRRVGNMHILFPKKFVHTGFGVIGPHWFGPLCVWGILVFATHFTLHLAAKVGIGSMLICIIFFTICTWRLVDVSFRDPGICNDIQSIPTQSKFPANQWRWCDLCRCFQPPDGAHCQDCNICVAGYDHHCVWMGTCIGRRNYRQFVKFNVSWLAYLLFTIIWLSIFGPLWRHQVVDKHSPF